MPRPERLHDIEIEKVEFGRIDISKLALDGTLLTAYGQLMTAFTKAGNVAMENTNYNGVVFHRTPTLDEQQDQLKTAQQSWDRHQGLYDRWAAGEEFTSEYDVTRAKDHARENNLPMFPWEKEGKPDIDPDMVDNIDAVLAESDDE